MSVNTPHNTAPDLIDTLQLDEFIRAALDGKSVQLDTHDIPRTGLAFLDYSHKLFEEILSQLQEWFIQHRNIHLCNEVDKRRLPLSHLTSSLKGDIREIEDLIISVAPVDHSIKSVTFAIAVTLQFRAHVRFSDATQDVCFAYNITCRKISQQTFLRIIVEKGTPISSQKNEEETNSSEQEQVRIQLAPDAPKNNEEIHHYLKAIHDITTQNNTHESAIERICRSHYDNVMIRNLLVMMERMICDPEFDINLVDYYLEHGDFLGLKTSHHFLTRGVAAGGFKVLKRLLLEGPTALIPENLSRQVREKILIAVTQESS